MQGLFCGMVGQIKQHENDEENDGYHDLETLLRADLILVLSAPFDVVPGRHCDPLCDDTLRFLDETAHIATADIHKHCATQQAILAADHGGPKGDPDARKVSQRSGSSISPRDENIAQR